LQNEPKLLRLAYWNCLKLAVQKGLKTLAFPSISTGSYGYPTADAATVALKAVVDFLKGTDNIEWVTFVLFSKVDFDIYANALKGLH
jgi:O-acetyl-ADP-ribose deacetylase (regulator of RNase III)